LFPGEGGEGEEPPAGYQEDDGGCPEDDEDEEEEEEEGVSGGSSGSPPRSPIPSSTDGVEQDVTVNERLPPRLVNNGFPSTFRCRQRLFVRRCCAVSPGFSATAKVESNILNCRQRVTVDRFP